MAQIPLCYSPWYILFIWSFNGSNINFTSLKDTEAQQYCDSCKASHRYITCFYVILRFGDINICFMRALKSDFLFHSRFGMLGSIDSNTGSPDLGWDTDQFPMDVRDTTLVMKVSFNLYYSTEVNSQLLNPQLNVHSIKTHICFSQKSINKSPSVYCISDFHWYFLGCPYFGLIKNFQANNYI